MPDNFPLTPGTGRNASTDEVTYSGDVGDVQLVRPVLVTGAEGSKTVVELTGDTANGLDVDITRLPSLVSGSANIGDVDIASIATGDNNIGNVDIVTMPAITLEAAQTLAVLTDITNWGNVVDNAAFVDGTTRLSMGGYIFDETAGTALTENDAAAARIDSKRAQVMVIEDGTTRGLRAGVADETGASAVDAQAVGGGTPHDSVNSGNPLYAGGEAIAHGANPTAVAAGDRTKFYANRHGIPFHIGGHPNIITLEYLNTGSGTDVAIITAGSGAKIVVTQIQVITDNANTAFPQFRAGFGIANTPTTTGVVLTHPGLPAGGGVSRGDGSGILGMGADGEDLRATHGAPTGGSLRVLVSYYTIES